MATKMQQRRGTASEWASQNPILAAGEIGVATDTKVLKVGDGVTTWNALIEPFPAIPIGGVIQFSGSVATLSANWQLCDGTNGTPDLRDRFIVGAEGTYPQGSIGGANTVALSVAEMPSHSHTVDPPSTTSSSDSHSHTATSAGSHLHSVNPPNTNTTSDAHNHTITSRGPTDNVAHGHPTGDQVSGGSAANTNEYGTVTTSSDTHLHAVDIAAFNSASGGDHTHPTDSKAHTHTTNIAAFTSASAGSGAAHENRPPFYALAMIMRIA